MRWNKKGVVLDLGGPGELDDTNPYYGAKISAIPHNGKLWLYYTGWDGVGPNWTSNRTLLAISDDGFRFRKCGAVIPLGAGGAVDDGNSGFGISVLKWQEKIWAYYGGWSSDPAKPCLAISDEGMIFHKCGVVLNAGTSGEIDDDGVVEWGFSAVENQGKIYLYYGIDDGSQNRIALAISDEGMIFHKCGVVLDVGAGGDVDDAGLHGLCAWKENNQIWLYYRASDGTDLHPVCLAISDEGMSFRKKGIVITKGGVGTVDDANYSYAGPCITKFKGRKLMYYQADDGTTKRIAVATSVT